MCLTETQLRFITLGNKFKLHFVAFSQILRVVFNPLSANPTKWSNTLKQFVGKLPTNSLGVFDHFVGLVLKGLTEPTLYRCPTK